MNADNKIVLPQGPKAIEGQELTGQYYEDAAPLLEKQIAMAGYRMAVWLDEIADAYNSQGGGSADDFAGEQSLEL